MDGHLPPEQDYKKPETFPAIHVVGEKPLDAAIDSYDDTSCFVPSKIGESLCLRDNSKIAKIIFEEDFNK